MGQHALEVILAMAVRRLVVYLLLHVQNLAILGDALDEVRCQVPQQRCLSGTIAPNQTISPAESHGH